MILISLEPSKIHSLIHVLFIYGTIYKYSIFRKIMQLQYQYFQIIVLSPLPCKYISSTCTTLVLPALTVLRALFYLLCNRFQGWSQNVKEVPQILREFLTLMTSQLMTSYGETNIAREKIKLSSIIITVMLNQHHS